MESQRLTAIEQVSMWTAIAAGIILFQEILSIAEHYLAMPYAVGASTIGAGFLTLLVFSIVYLILDTVYHGILQHNRLSREGTHHEGDQGGRASWRTERRNG